MGKCQQCQDDAVGSRRQVEIFLTFSRFVHFSEFCKQCTNGCFIHPCACWELPKPFEITLRVAARFCETLENIVIRNSIFGHQSYQEIPETKKDREQTPVKTDACSHGVNASFPWHDPSVLPLPSPHRERQCCVLLSEVPEPRPGLSGIQHMLPFCW